MYIVMMTNERSTKIVKSHSAFSDNFADYEFKRKVPVSIYIFTWTVVNPCFVYRSKNSAAFAQTSI